MSERSRPVSRNRQSMKTYIRSIGRHYLNAVIAMTLLIAATYLMLVVALDRHSLQQSISFLTSNQFIRFEQFANKTRALTRASADPNMPDYMIDPMREDIHEAIGEVRVVSRQMGELHDQIKRNFLEKLNPSDELSEQLRLDLEERLNDFLEHAARIADATAKERQERYSSWGPIENPVTSDSILIRQFGDLVGHTKVIGTGLLALIAATVILARLLLFTPLLKKLRNEYRRTIDFENRLQQLAHTDALTGLSNRTAFNHTLSNFFGDLERTGTGFSLLLVDLHRFKSVNDNLGHQAGDAVLRHVAGALERAFRSSDIIARLGGDEFTVLVPGLSNATALAAMAERAVEAIAAEIEFDGQIIEVSASIGGAVVPSHASDEASLLRVVDLALYTAKGRRNSAFIFDETTLAQRLEQNQLSLALVLAADRNEFVVHYQPKVDLRTGTHLGFEALVRWQHPELGLLQPGRFLPLMEGTQLIRGMTRAVVAAVGRDLDVWKAMGLIPGTISINMPEVVLTNQEGYNLLSETIQENGLEWSDFAVEITEDVFLNRAADRILDTVARFREHGLSVSLDDFGTGFASLVHLRDFPFDELKIDRSFVAGIGSDARSEQIIRAVIDLSRNLGKHCVAEGIETEAQSRFLVEAGCEIGQGYLFAKPLPAAQAADRLPRWPRIIAGRNFHCG